MIKTEGFNKFDAKILFVHLIRALKGNLETFIALSVILIQVLYGGVVNIAFTGVIVFLIFIEEFQG